MTVVKVARYEQVAKKAMTRLLPIIGIIYFLSYVDRANVALAKTALAADAGIGAAAYGLGAGLFFVSYALLEVPSNLALHRVGPRVWIARIAVTWGAVSAAMMFVQNETSFYVLRLLLGAAEAGLVPALMYMVTLWFSQKHRVTMVGLIYTAPCIGALVGSPVSGALMELDGAGGLHGWQWMFLIEGLATIVVGGLAWRYLPDRPSDARWLTAEESALLADRVVVPEVPSGARARGNFRLAFGNPIVLVLAAIFFVNQAIQAGVAFNFPAVLQELGLKSSFLVGLVAGGVGLTGLAGVLLFPWLQRRYGHEVLLIGICAGAVLVLMIGFLVSTDAVWRVSLVLVSSFFGLGTLPLFWSVAMSRMAGVVAAAGLAFFNSVGIIGSFVGPVVYGRIEEATGSLFAPYSAIVAAACVGLLLVGLLAAMMRREKTAETRPVPEMVSDRA